MKQKNIITIIALFILILTNGSFSLAGVGTISSSYNDSIKPALKNKIHETNKKIVQSIIDDDFDSLLNISIKNLKKDESKFKEHFNLMKQFFTKVPFSEFSYSHDFHANYLGLGSTQLPIHHLGSKNEFFIYLPFNQGKDKFVSILETQGKFKDNILVFVYEQDGRNWLLEGFHVGIIRISGSTSLDYLDLVQKMIKQEHYLTAALWLDIALKFKRPAPFIQYDREEELKEAFEIITPKVKELKIPFELNIPSKPNIFFVSKMFFKNYNNELMPLIHYVTKEDFLNKEKIDKEINIIVRELGEKFPSLLSYSDHIYFRVFNKLPGQNNHDEQYYEKLKKL